MLGDDVPVAQVRIGEPHAGLVARGADDDAVRGGQARAEEARRVVGADQIGTLDAVEITKHVAAVGLRAPALVGVRYGVVGVGAVAAHAVDLLHVVPFGQLRVDGKRAVVLQAEVLLGIGPLRRDEDDAVAGPAAVERRGRGTLQYRHALDIVGVDARDAVAEVVSAVGAGAAVVRIVERHAVNDVERLVVAGHFGAASQNHARGARRAAGRLADHQTRDTSGQRVDDVGLLGLGEHLALDLVDTVSEGFALALDSEGRYDDLVEHLAVLVERDFEVGAVAHGDFGRFVAQIADRDCRPGVGLKLKLADGIGGRAVGGSLFNHAGSDDGTVAILDDAPDRDRLFRTGRLCECGIRIVVCRKAASVSSGEREECGQCQQNAFVEFVHR